MIIRMVILSFLLLCPLMMQATDFIYDADSTSIVLKKRKNKIYYHHTKWIRVSLDISYRTGVAGFFDYFYSQYGRHFSVVNDKCFSKFNKKKLYIEEGPNGSCKGVILFNSSLKIVDIKIIERGYSNESYDYDGMVKYILEKSEGCWNILSSKRRKRWYIFMFNVKLR